MHLVRSTQVHGRSHALAHLQAHSQRVCMPVSLSVNLPHNAHTSLSPHYQHHCSAHTLTVQAFHHSVSERRVITAWVSTQEQEMFILLCVRRILESLNQDPLKLMPWDAHRHQKIGERWTRRKHVPGAFRSPISQLFCSPPNHCCEVCPGRRGRSWRCRWHNECWGRKVGVVFAPSQSWSRQRKGGPWFHQLRSSPGAPRGHSTAAQSSPWLAGRGWTREESWAFLSSLSPAQSGYKHEQRLSSWRQKS